eukprot:gnl/TRDRNA2_/TRDRNA2_128089_c1_seq1.p1 gnl/TRDRNA2_/TRDRNA2_128089_c1~~gnl/TRDRNA2_/TRDRNA2_128089_c1_seq1.p1  ORF type:complete len:217 (-),score=12.52 gnl/TRDRNA2_/TRDRNA2_128089_c1_seq1:65-715(-)
MMKNLLMFGLILFFGTYCSSKAVRDNENDSAGKKELLQPGDLDTATLAGGCFWCVEAAFEQIIGVKEAVSGYAAGTKENADYGIVSSGRTKHSEAVQVYYDPTVIDFETILDIFFTAHDPTQLNRQGPDVGPQYRSAAYFHSPSQEKIIRKKIKELSPEFSKPIVTEVEPFTTFFVAEDYHQDYERKNPFQPYILAVSKPKVDKVKQKFPDLIKEE